MVNKEWLGKGAEMATDIVDALEETFRTADKNEFFALGGAVLATALDTIAIKHGIEPAELRAKILMTGLAVDHEVNEYCATCGDCHQEQ